MVLTVIQPTGAAMRGEAWAAALSERYYGRVLHVVLGMVDQPDDALDIVQQTFERAWRYRASLRAEQSELGWLCAIAVRESLSWRRRWKRAIGEYLAANHDLIEGSPGSTQERLELLDLVDRLPAKQRQILVLHYLADLSLDGCAEVLGIPVETARSRVKTALRAIREELRQ